jgi:hypothetical protein
MADKTTTITLTERQRKILLGIFECMGSDFESDLIGYGYVSMKKVTIRDGEDATDALDREITEIEKLLKRK